MMTKIEETRLGVSADFEPSNKGIYQIINSELSKMSSHGMYECLKSTFFFNYNKSVNAPYHCPLLGECFGDMDSPLKGQ